MGWSSRPQGYACGPTEARRTPPRLPDALQIGMTDEEYAAAVAAAAEDADPERTKRRAIEAARLENPV